MLGQLDEYVARRKKIQMCSKCICRCTWKLVNGSAA